MTLPAYHPPTRILMGPGPSDVPARVLEAMARPTVGHLDPTFSDMMESLKTLLRRTFRTSNEVTIPISGPGSAAMEACFVNLVEEGDTVVVCRNGVFGERMRLNVERCGGKAVVVDDPWGEPVDPAKVRAALREHPEAGLLAFVQAETSTGAHTPPEPLARLAHEHDCLVLVDAVTALGGTPVEVDDWDLDAVYAGSQKCLSCPPGLAPLTFGDRAVDRLHRRKTPARSWFFDLDLLLGYWGEEASRSYHHTAPVNALMGLYEALRMLDEEGLEAAWERHHQNGALLTEGLAALGLVEAVEPSARLPQLHAVEVPEGVDEALVRRRLLAEDGIEIGAGLGASRGRLWRIGLMGHASSRHNVTLCLAALERLLRR